MQLDEFIINKVYRTKLGELCIGIKLKEEDSPTELEQVARLHWREGTPLKGYKIDEFQKES